MEKLIKEKGFTLIEMIMVISIMGILVAVLIPSITYMTVKTRIATDIRSIQIIQRQLDLYRSEHGGSYPGSSGNSSKRPEAEGVIKGLVKASYINLKNPEAMLMSQQIGLQLGISIVWDEEEDNLALGKLGEAQGYYKVIVNKILEELAEGTYKKWINVSLN